MVKLLESLVYIYIYTYIYIFECMWMDFTRHPFSIYVLRNIGAWNEPQKKRTKQQVGFANYKYTIYIYINLVKNEWSSRLEDHCLFYASKGSSHPADPPGSTPAMMGCKNLDFPRVLQGQPKHSIINQYPNLSMQSITQSTYPSMQSIYGGSWNVVQHPSHEWPL
jgi:hypothetical protein